MKFKGFTGAAYRSLSVYAASEDCVNFFPEVIEDPDETAKSNVVLYPTPCTGTYSESPYGVARACNQPARALLELNGRLFGVNGNAFFQDFTNLLNPPLSDSPVNWGTVANDAANSPAFMIANGVTTTNQQIFISASDRAYIFDLNGVFTPLATVPGFIAGRGAAFLDNYFISLIPNTNGFQISAINNGRLWDAADVAYTQGQSDYLVNLIADREYLWLFGSRRSEIWYNQGGQFFPFAIQPGAFLEIGLGAAASLIQADNSLFWIGQDKRGGLSAWRANGLTPIRVSNHAVEAAWSKYVTVTDCVAYSFLWRGHTFIRFIFPTAKAAWTYDCAASRMLGYAVWHRNRFTDNNGSEFAPLERAYAYVNGYHVVSSGGVDGFPGTLYQFTDDTLMPVDPFLQLRFSKDGGNTFGAERKLAVGKAGEFTKRCLTNLLGAGRDWVFWARCVDYGECGGIFPIVRDRVCPHIFNENKIISIKRMEIEAQKGIGGIAKP